MEIPFLKNQHFKKKVQGKRSLRHIITNFQLHFQESRITTTSPVLTQKHLSHKLH